MDPIVVIVLLAAVLIWFLLEPAGLTSSDPRAAPSLQQVPVMQVPAMLTPPVPPKWPPASPPSPTLSSSSAYSVSSANSYHNLSSGHLPSADGTPLLGALPATAPASTAPAPHKKLPFLSLPSLPIPWRKNVNGNAVTGTAASKGANAKARAKGDTKADTKADTKEAARTKWLASAERKKAARLAAAQAHREARLAAAADAALARRATAADRDRCGSLPTAHPPELPPRRRCLSDGENAHTETQWPESERKPAAHASTAEGVRWRTTVPPSTVRFPPPRLRSRSPSSPSSSSTSPGLLPAVPQFVQPTPHHPHQAHTPAPALPPRFLRPANRRADTAPNQFAPVAVDPDAPALPPRPEYTYLSADPCLGHRGTVAYRTSAPAHPPPPRIPWHNESPQPASGSSLVHK